MRSYIPKTAKQAAKDKAERAAVRAVEIARTQQRDAILHSSSTEQLLRLPQDQCVLLLIDLHLIVGL